MLHAVEQKKNPEFYGDYSRLPIQMAQTGDLVQVIDLLGLKLPLSDRRTISSSSTGFQFECFASSLYLFINTLNPSCTWPMSRYIALMVSRYLPTEKVNLGLESDSKKNHT